MSGINWKELRPEGDVNAGWSVISDDACKNILAVGGVSTTAMYVSHDGGNSWSALAYSLILGAYSGNGKYAYGTKSVGNYYHLYRSDDYGDTFVEISFAESQPQFIYQIAISYDGSVVIIGTGESTSGLDKKLMYVSTDYGITFSRKYPGDGVEPQKYCQYLCASSSGRHIYCALSDDGYTSIGCRVFASHDYGNSWSFYIRYGLVQSIGQMACSSDGSVVFCDLHDGFRSRILVSTDYGSTFVIRTDGSGGTAGFNGSFTSISCSNSGLVLIISAANNDIGNSGLLYSTTRAQKCYQTNPTGHAVETWQKACVSKSGGIFLAGGVNGYRLWKGNLDVGIGNCDVQWWN